MTLTTKDVITQARQACASVCDEDWHDAVERKIVEFAGNQEQAEKAIIQLSIQLFGAAGII